MTMHLLWRLFVSPLALLTALTAAHSALADQAPARDIRQCEAEAKAAVDTRLTEERVIYQLAGGFVTRAQHKVYFDARADKCLVDMSFRIAYKGALIVNRYVTDPAERVIFATLTTSSGKTSPDNDEAKFVCNYGVSYNETNTCTDAREFDSIVKALTAAQETR